MEDSIRKLARIVKLDDVQKHYNADTLDIATVGGWKVVVKRDEFKTGDLAIYFEIDSFIPTAIAPFLTKPGHFPKTYNEVEGERLKTVRLRGQVSQGLLLPVKSGIGPMRWIINAKGLMDTVVEGDDVTENLGVQKWEPPVSANLAGNAKGNFPHFIMKTDQERCQNASRDIFIDNADAKYEVTMKLDGSSMTAFNYTDDGVSDVGVCSRNLQLKVDEENSGNSFVNMFVHSGLEQALKSIPNIAIQGELMGEGIQGNQEKITGHKFFIFEMQDLKTRTKLGAAQRKEIVDQLYELGVDRKFVQHAPVLFENVTLRDLNILSMDELLAFAEGPSLTAKQREGVVFKRMDGDFSFKAISNEWLIATGK